MIFSSTAVTTGPQRVHGSSSLFYNVAKCLLSPPRQSLNGPWNSATLNFVYMTGSLAILFSSQVKMYILAHYCLLLYYIFKILLWQHIRCLRVNIFNNNPIKATQESTFGKNGTRKRNEITTADLRTVQDNKIIWPPPPLPPIHGTGDLLV